MDAWARKIAFSRGIVLDDVILATQRQAVPTKECEQKTIKYARPYIARC